MRQFSLVNYSVRRPNLRMIWRKWNQGKLSSVWGPPGRWQCRKAVENLQLFWLISTSIAAAGPPSSNKILIEIDFPIYIAFGASFGTLKNEIGGVEVKPHAQWQVCSSIRAIRIPVTYATFNEQWSISFGWEARGGGRGVSLRTMLTSNFPTKVENFYPETLARRNKANSDYQRQHLYLNEMILNSDCATESALGLLVMHLAFDSDNLKPIYRVSRPNEGLNF